MSRLQRCYVVHYHSKRYRRSYAKRYIPQFERIDGELELNEQGEYVTKYGDWLHGATETVHVRDRKIWESEFRKLRKKYRQEYSEKFGARLAKFTQIADSKMYHLSLQNAQRAERKRLSDIRVNALKAANAATHSRIRMESKRKKRVMQYDGLDQQRDIIREMVWEQPAKNWITADNINGTLNVDFIDKLMANELDTAQHAQYRGLPKPGYYDTMEGLFGHSDRYFEFADKPSNDKAVTTITKQPISWYVRKNDSKDEYVEEIYQSQQRLNRHLAPKSKLKRDKQQQQDIEYEVDSKNIVPNYWLNIDFEQAFQDRAGNLDKSPIFIANEHIKEEYDAYEDHRLLWNPQYYQLLKNASECSQTQIMQALHTLFGRDVTHIVHDIVDADNQREMEREREHKRWALYREFHAKMKHFSGIHWKCGKINFDSGMKQWRRDFLNWRYLVFENNEEHIAWRQRLRSTQLSPSDAALSRKAIVRLQQLEHLIVARRSGPELVQHLLRSIEDGVLKVFYIWFEELTEHGEEICMGKAWSMNRYQEQTMLPPTKCQQVPLEYFTIGSNQADRS
eukprot:CAMPEP_0197032162 /NCGR_PEP_ID=MMETSP1384-20130603/10903_1 /TAXON_ID=29189 /ORGANISM="Ammonia sp." /LENGTH=564 /DNA_ID=CAMNT_0042461777 /DNA_START=46 /DNA_END=1740 /DNA_ORIENTATION=+